MMKARTSHFSLINVRLCARSVSLRHDFGICAFEVQRLLSRACYVLGSYVDQLQNAVRIAFEAIEESQAKSVAPAQALGIRVSDLLEGQGDAPNLHRSLMRT
jgi:hypothetical protein